MPAAALLLRFWLGLFSFALLCAVLAKLKGKPETTTRCLTLAALVTLISLAMATGVWTMAGLLALAGLRASRELGELGDPLAGMLPWTSGTIGALLLTSLVPLTKQLVALLAGASVIAALAAARLLMRERKHVSPTATALLGIHVGIGLVALQACYRLALPLLLATIILMQFNDGFAYLVGRRWGRTKLAPRVSPGKTAEGLLGGALAAGAVLCLCHTPVLPLLRGCSWLHDAGLLAIVVGLGVLGDLLYSLAKRRAALDDYGASLPGHGGVLDRLDSLLAAMPVILIWHLLMR